MNRFIYPGSRKIEGPWLLDKESLQTFETMVNEITSEFSADTGEEYESQYTIAFTDGKCVEESSLSAFDTDNDIKNLLPQKMIIKIHPKAHCISCTELTFLLNKKLIQSFEYNIRDVHTEEVKLRIINKIEDWIDENRPSKLLAFWSDIYGLFPLLCSLVLGSTLGIFIVNITSSSLYQKTLSSQVQSILENGIDESNYMLALEYLLSKEFSYVPSSFQGKLDLTIYIIVMIFSILFSFIGYFCPKANIAIGAGRRKVKFWKTYIKFITISIPTLILLPLFINFISSFF